MLDVQTVLGSGSSPEVLKRAGMAHTEMVIAVTDSDETNMIACLLASTQCRIPIRIARIRNMELNGDCSLFGTDRLNIDLCINPEREAVSNVMDLLDSNSRGRRRSSALRGDASGFWVSRSTRAPP